MIKINDTRIKINSILSYSPYYYEDDLAGLSLYFSTGGGHKYVEYEHESHDKIKKLVEELDKIFGI